MKQMKQTLGYLRKASPYIKGMSITLVLGAVFALSNLLRNQELGEILAVIYGLAAVAWRVPSGVTFKMALVTMVFIPIISIYDPTSELPDIFAVYAFLLLIIGLICAFTERIFPGKTWARCEIYNRLKKIPRKIYKSSIK